MQFITLGVKEFWVGYAPIYHLYPQNTSKIFCSQKRKRYTEFLFK